MLDFDNDSPVNDDTLSDIDRTTMNLNNLEVFKVLDERDKKTAGVDFAECYKLEVTAYNETMIIFAIGYTEEMIWFYYSLEEYLNDKDKDKGILVYDSNMQINFEKYDGKKFLENEIL